MNFRNTELLEKLEKHPLRATLAKVLDLAEDFRGAAEQVVGNRDLSPEGRQKSLHGKLRAAIRDLRDARQPLNDLKAALDGKRAAVRQPAFDRSDIVGAMLRAEIRTAMRGMDPSARASVLIGPNANPCFADALLEAPSVLSGLTENENFLVEAARGARLEGLFGPELAEIAELESTFDEAKGICDLARVDLQQACGLDVGTFERFAEPIENRKNAPWLMNVGDTIVRVRPDKKGTAEFQAPASESEKRDGKFFESETAYLADRAAA